MFIMYVRLEVCYTYLKPATALLCLHYTMSLFLWNMSSTLTFTSTLVTPHFGMFPSNQLSNHDLYSTCNNSPLPSINWPATPPASLINLPILVPTQLTLPSQEREDMPMPMLMAMQCWLDKVPQHQSSAELSRVRTSQNNGSQAFKWSVKSYLLTYSYVSKLYPVFRLHTNIYQG